MKFGHLRDAREKLCPETYLFVSVVLDIGHSAVSYILNITRLGHYLLY